jgi:hypothetical protein
VEAFLGKQAGGSVQDLYSAGGDAALAAGMCGSVWLFQISLFSESALK